MMRFALLLLLILTGSMVFAQEVKVNDSVYEIKKDLIFINDVDITNTLSEEERSKILAAFEHKKSEKAKAKLSKEKIDKAEKAQKRAEKQQKKAEKKQKKAEKEMKQKVKAQTNYDKAIKTHKDAITKYEKLKKKGKLSPIDEEKWLEKIEKLNSKIEKTKAKLK